LIYVTHIRNRDARVSHAKATQPCNTPCEAQPHLEASKFMVRLYNLISPSCKGKVVPVLVFFFTEHRAMKAYWGNGGTASRILWSRH